LRKVIVLTFDTMIATLRYNILIALMLCVFGFTATAQNKKAADDGAGISFMENSWNEALKKAAKENKYIFVDAYAVWCGPCKMLKRTTFKNKDVADFYNKNFINVAMDMEKGQGPELASQWALEGYPTLIIFNSKGKRVSHTIGFIQADDLLRFGKQALAAR
jgi:thioredoxin 1